jgi:hypothetical protein
MLHAWQACVLPVRAGGNPFLISSLHPQWLEASSQPSETTCSAKRGQPSGQHRRRCWQIKLNQAQSSSIKEKLFFLDSAMAGPSFIITYNL